MACRRGEYSSAEALPLPLWTKRQRITPPFTRPNLPDRWSFPLIEGYLPDSTTAPTSVRFQRSAPSTCMGKPLYRLTLSPLLLSRLLVVSFMNFECEVLVAIDFRHPNTRDGKHPRCLPLFR